MHCRKERHKIDWHIGASGGEYRRVAIALDGECKNGSPAVDHRVQPDAMPEVVVLHASLIRNGDLVAVYLCRTDVDDRPESFRACFTRPFACVNLAAFDGRRGGFPIS